MVALEAQVMTPPPSRELAQTSQSRPWLEPFLVRKSLKAEAGQRAMLVEKESAMAALEAQVMTPPLLITPLDKHLIQGYLAHKKQLVPS
jgi:hypothetical protein